MSTTAPGNRSQVRPKRLFVACIVALVTTSFGFISRAFLINEWAQTFNLTQQQVGALQGAGLFPFALSIIFFSLIVDRIGYGRAMVFAFLGHAISAILTITAKSYEALYVATFLFALANGTVEAVINPVTATLFPKDKTHYLNILHAGWPGGLVLGGILAIMLGHAPWQWKMGLFLIPTALYGLMMVGQKFPLQERVAAGVSYGEMLKEFGWASCLIVSFFVVFAFDSVFTSLKLYETNVSWVVAAIIAAAPTLFFALKYNSFGRPMFVFLLLVMILLATTELGTDSWIAGLMTPVLSKFGESAGNWVLVYTSAIMLVLRSFAGPIVHRVSPLGLLCVCAAIAAAGLFSIAHAGSSAGLVFLAATCYGVGKTFFWPTTLGVVTEQFPRGGAMMINAIAGVGMISVGVLGGPLLGAMQDNSLDARLKHESPAIHAKVAEPEKSAYLMTFQPIDKAKVAVLPPAERQVIERVSGENSQGTLAQVAGLPAIMFLCYVGLIFYFRSKGGYKAVELTTAAPHPGGAPSS